MYLSETHEKNAAVLEHPDLPEIKDSYRRMLHQLSWKTKKVTAKEDQSRS